MSKSIQAARKPGPAASLVKPAAAAEVPGSHRCPLADICKGRTTPLKVPKGKTIFVPDQLAEHVYLVHHGVIGGFKVWENGDETLQTVLMTGQICGAEAIVLRDQGKIPLRDYYARTYTPTTMCRMTMTEFERTIQTDPVVGLRLVKLLAERLHDFKQLMGFSSRGSGEKRLVALLLLMGKRIGTPSADGIVITEKFSHQALAELTGCNRPTVTRNLLSLQARRLIKVERKQVHLLDPDGLEQILR
jgi:CRP/FNR family transcriptional regulator